MPDTATPDLSLPRKQNPSKRDMEIYAAVALGRSTQQAAAARFGITQPRVSQIVYRVAAWIAETTPDSATLAHLPQHARLRLLNEPPPFPLCPDAEQGAGEESPTPLARLRQAEANAKARLEFVFEQSLLAWQLSKEPETVTLDRTRDGEGRRGGAGAGESPDR